MNTSYCTGCGCKRKENTVFCPNCGRKTGLLQEMNLPFSCMAAYLPGLFFVPLLTGFHDNRHRKCASQGLWITILAAISIIAFPYLLKWGVQMQLFDWNYLTSLYQNWNEANWTNKFIPLFGRFNLIPMEKEAQEVKKHERIFRRNKMREISGR